MERQMINKQIENWKGKIATFERWNKANIKDIDLGKEIKAAQKVLEALEDYEAII